MNEESDLLIESVCRAQELVMHGDCAGAQAIYEKLWTEAMASADHYQSCVVAHFMAHAQNEPADQLLWHLRALEAADAVHDDRVVAFYPSLYANVAEVSLRLDIPAQARYYIDRAHATEHMLANDGYGYMMRSLIARVAKAVEQVRDSGPMKDFPGPE